MTPPLIPPAHWMISGIPAITLTIFITGTGLFLFTYVIFVRLLPLLKGAEAPFLNDFRKRAINVLTFWLGQKRHPRYPAAGALHITLFSGFIILSINTLSLAVMGIFPGFTFFGPGGGAGAFYHVLKGYAATLVLIAALVAAVRRVFFMADRYRVPEKQGKEHTAEALQILFLIMILMITEGLFDASLSAAAINRGTAFPAPLPLTTAWIFASAISSFSLESLQNIHVASYFIHDITFFYFLCLLPFGKHFHVITSLPNVFFKRIERGTVKPVLYGEKGMDLTEIESFGVKKIEDFTWKGMLDFYSCVDCGRCSDNCPATTAGSPLSPRFISIKGRGLIYRNYPVFGENTPSRPLMGDIYEEDEIWACTTCGACEEECPVCIEYIDKIVDLRRGMVDDGNVPRTLQKPLSALAKRGNPFGKTEKKRSEWTEDESFSKQCQVKSMEREESFETLFFVDSVGSYDDRIQKIVRDAALILSLTGEDFGILGKQEKDSGNEVRRFGEEMLFAELMEHNTGKILESGVKRIVTADPHAYNALKHDYTGLPQVEHISTFINRSIKEGKLSLKKIDTPGKIHTYHDPCYLGRHNSLYTDPRAAIDGIPGVTRIEMKRSFDRSFCCGGGGLMLFYEPEAETRIGVIRVEMAREAGADIIVTACPFCMLNLEDALKVTGLDREMEVVDLCELILRHIL